jgi:hypothetical protein
VTGLLDRLAALPLRIDAIEVRALRRPAAGGGMRTTAVVELRGGSERGSGEDVTFQEADRLDDASRLFGLAGARTLGGLWELLDSTDLFERAPIHDVVRNYRRWAVEAAALDLALRQASLSLCDVVGREPLPVSFVVSPAPGMLRRFPRSRLKVDAPDLEPGLPVDVVDFKGAGDEALVHRALEAYPDGLLEDPPFRPPTGRVSWDVGILGAADLERLDEPPAAINVKPARVGGVGPLLGLYDACARAGIAVYGGGQHELGPGRRQIQLLAALFHPEAPNDVAPVGYNEPEPAPDLPASPLSVPRRPGFG